MRPRSLGTSSCWTRGEIEVPIVQTTVAPIIIFSIVQFDALVGSRDGTRIQQDADAGFLHLLSGELAERRRHLGQDMVLGMDQGDNNVFLFEVAVKAGAAANQFVDFSSDLNAAETCSHDNEAEVPAQAIGVARCFSLFQLAYDVLAKVNGVAHDLEGKSMLGHARDDTQVAFRAAGDHDVVVMQASEHSGAIVKFDL